MSDNHKILIHFLLANDSVTVDSVANYLNINQDEAQNLINECIEKKLLTNSINNNGINEYYVVVDNAEAYIVENSDEQKISTNNVVINDGKGSGELLVGAVALIAGITFLCLFLYSCTGRDKTDEPIRDFCTDDDYAYIAAKKFIKEKLKSPSSAKFSHITETTVTKYNGCIFEFSGYVDAQNSFGATLREDYKIKVKYSETKDTYYLIDLIM